MIKRNPPPKPLGACIWIAVALAAGCTQEQESKMQPTPKHGFRIIDFASGPENMTFVAAVQFRRTRSELVKAPGFEKQTNLNSMPNMTWWWYEVDLVPESVVEGQWPPAEEITLHCRHYLATAPDKSWVGILVKDQAGVVKWLKDYAIRDGKVVDPLENKVTGETGNLPSIILAYRRLNGL